MNLRTLREIVPLRTLAVLLLVASTLTAGCLRASAADVDVSLRKRSARGIYVVELLPPPTPPAINRLHTWRIRVTTPSGDAIAGAGIQVDGGMPEHGHGLPTHPRVTRELGDGTYLVEGMKFSMAGTWELRFDITSAAGADRAVFLTIVETLPRAAASTATPRDRWTPPELRILASMQRSAAGPRTVDVSNAYERDPQAAALGRALFEDVRLSRTGTVACATCHDARREFQDDRPLARGVATGTRRTMPVPGAADAPFLFWDGRKDSLWSQALGPLEAAVEHGTNRMRVATLVATHYAAQYERVFGPLPRIDAALPDASPLGAPAERAAWRALPAATRTDVNRVFANVGKAIAAFESRFSYGESRFDRYVAATLASDARGQTVLDPQEVRGLRLFIDRGQCATCHTGPAFTDHAFHNTGVPPRSSAEPDRGRAAGIETLLADEFNCRGPYSDARPEQCGELEYLATSDPRALGAFRTPSLRNVARRAPYMHAGQFDSLEQVVAHYAASPRAALGHSELARDDDPQPTRHAIRLSEDDVRDLTAFLDTLSGPIVQSR
jgi:cytochrome c peroxidase